MKYEVELPDEQARAVDKAYPMGPQPYFADDLVDAAMYGLAVAIRANPPKPPRMEEPDWGQMVIACTRDASHRLWLHYLTQRNDGSPVMNQWRSVFGDLASWDDLLDPKPWTAGA